MSAVAELARSLYLTLHGAGWIVAYTLAIGSLVGVAVWCLLGVMRRRGAWARYALSCGALVLVAGIPLQVGLTIHGQFDGHVAFAERIAVDLMGERDWASEVELVRAMEARHDGAMSTWIHGPAATWLGAGLALVGALWIGMSALLLLRFFRDWRSAVVLRTKDVRPVSPRWLECLETVRRRVDVWHPVRLAISPHVSSPALVGWWRPAILVPPEAHRHLSDDEVEAVLAHELAHIRRGDYAMNLVQTAIESVLFFHPVIRWLGVRIRDEREFCSDDLAQRSIGGSLAAYLRALATLESLRTNRPPEPAVAAHGGSLLHRIRRLVEIERHRIRPRFDVDLAIVAMCLVALWIPTRALSSRTRPATMAVMKHELYVPRDFDRIAAEAAAGSGHHQMTTEQSR